MSENNGNKSSQEQENLETQQDDSRRSFVDKLERPSSRYSARYARKSLENTNVRSDDFSEYMPNRMLSRSSLGSSAERYSPLSNEVPRHGDNKENRKEDTTLHPREGDTHRITENRSSSSMDDRLGDSKNVARRDESPRRRNDENSQSENSSLSCLSKSSDAHVTGTSTDSLTRRGKDQVDRHSVKEEQDREDVKRNDNRQFEVEKSLPWLRMNPSDKNLSKQMFLYLTHKELKCKIEDLARRELHACNKQYWDEALRLRDMRNRLELLREKKLYNMENLELDDEARKSGLINIDKREAELSEREDACRDSTMYSEDAKALWKKWVHEDEKSVIEDARLQREKLMSSLEKEWQNLAIRDKEKISRSYQKVMNDSALQEEHKLAAAINASRMKSVSSSLK